MEYLNDISSNYSTQRDYSKFTLYELSKKNINVSFDDLSEREREYINKNINLKKCNITNIVKLSTGKLITLLINDIPDNYKNEIVYKKYYLTKWKKTTGKYFNKIVNDFSYIVLNNKEYNFLSKKTDFIGYKDNMGCELTEIKELLVPSHLRKVLDNSKYLDSEENIYKDSDVFYDTNIFSKKENDV